MIEKTDEGKIERSKIFAGIDVGVPFSKAVLIRNKEVISEGVVYSGNNYMRSAKNAFETALEKGKVPINMVEKIVSTGCGANLVPYENRRRPEITCQGLGINWLVPSARSIIEIGGQMAKVICIDEKGRAVGFDVSEKCATGSGSILNVLGNILDVKPSELGRLSKKGRNVTRFASSCTVFLETEVISRISEGQRIEDIVTGVYEIISQKIFAMAKNVKIERDCVFTGGAAVDMGLKQALEKCLGMPTGRPVNPFTTCAIGAAVAAQREEEEERMNS